MMDRTIQPPSLLALTEHGAGPSAWVMSLALLVVIAVQSLRLLPHAHRHHFVGVVAWWIFAILMAPDAAPSAPRRLDHRGGARARDALDRDARVPGHEPRGAGDERAVLDRHALRAHVHVAHGPRGVGETTTAGLAIVGMAVAAALGGTLMLPFSRLSPLPAVGARRESGARGPRPAGAPLSRSRRADGLARGRPRERALAGDRGRRHVARLARP